MKSTLCLFGSRLLKPAARLAQADLLEGKIYLILSDVNNGKYHLVGSPRERAAGKLWIR